MNAWVRSMTYCDHAIAKMLAFFPKGKELRFGRTPVPFMMESGNMENVMVMVPTVFCSQKQRSMQGSTAVDGKMGGSMYVFELLHAHCDTCMYTVIYLLSFFREMGCTSTITRPFMRGTGVKASGVAGEGCTMRVEISMRESG